MKKLKLIYNPNSGDKSFPDFLDEVIHVFHKKGYETHVFRSLERGDIAAHVLEMPHDYYDRIVVSGGDGTLNSVVNALIEAELDIPIGIIPAGTANDMSSYLEIPRDFEKAAGIAASDNICRADVGQVSGESGSKYFINVCSAGLLTGVSQSMETGLKNTLGKLAYYIKGLEQIPNFIPLDVRVTNSEETFEEKIYLFLVLNSAGTGGFPRISPEASITDGLFDFVAIKARPIHEIAVLFIKLLAGDITNDSNVVHFRDSYIKIEPLFDDVQYRKTDVDGEPSPDMPVEIINLPGKIRLVLP